MKKLPLIVAGLIFAGVAILHAVRYIKGWEVVFNHFTIPLNWSITGAVIAGVLALWMFMAAYK